MESTFFSAFVRAARSLVIHSRLVAASRPGTLLRVLCIAAMDYAVSCDGRHLSAERRRVLAAGLDLGAMLNDYFDESEFDPTEYRNLRDEFSVTPENEAAFQIYLRRLRRLERGRPVMPAGMRMLNSYEAEELARAVTFYRQGVLEVSLDFVFALTHGSRLPPPEGKPLYREFIALLQLLQILDDLIDWPHDAAAGLPTHVTALTNAGALPTDASVCLRELMDAAWRQAVTRSMDAQPLKLAAWMFRLAGRMLIRWRSPALHAAMKTGALPSPSRFIFGNDSKTVIRRERFSLASPVCLLYASDLHLRRSNACHASRQLAAIAHRERPDAVLLGGDLVDGASGLQALSSLVRALGRIAPVMAVPGNHDRWAGLAFVREAVLRGGGSWLLDAPFRFSNGIIVHGDMPQKVPHESSVLCAHYPSVFERACASGFGLVLAGHLHGGQFVFGKRNGQYWPGAFLYRHNGPRFVRGRTTMPGAFLYRHNGPRFVRGRTTMLVSNGFHDTFPVRWNCPRDVLLVTS